MLSPERHHCLNAFKAEKYYGLMNATHDGLSISLMADLSAIPLSAATEVYATEYRI